MTETPLLPITVVEFDKNDRGEVVRVRLDRFKDNLTIDARVWFTATSGELCPGNKGLTLGIRHLPDLAAGFERALAKAKTLRLIDGEAS